MNKFPKLRYVLIKMYKGIPMEENHGLVRIECIYQKVRGLDLIEIESFCKEMTLYWCNRYILGKYDDFWASLLNSYLGLTPATRQQLYRWGDQDFVKPLEKANVPFLKQIISTLQLFTSNSQVIQKLVTTVMPASLCLTTVT